MLNKTLSRRSTQGFKDSGLLKDSRISDLQRRIAVIEEWIQQQNSPADPESISTDTAHHLPHQLTISEAAAAVRRSPETLRRLERNGVIAPARRDMNGRRIYEQSDVARIIQTLLPSHGKELVNTG